MAISNRIYYLSYSAKNIYGLLLSALRGTINPTLHHFTKSFRGGGGTHFWSTSHFVRNSTKTFKWRARRLFEKKRPIQVKISTFYFRKGRRTAQKYQIEKSCL